MKGAYSFAALAILVFATAHAQLTIGQATEAPLHSDLSRAFGFINGQRFSLNRIKKEYPDLSLRTQKAELEFQIAFGDAERNINVALQDIFADRYSEFVATTKKQLESTLATQPLNPEIAANFIAEVESRAKGRVPSPILETLLTYQFKNHPVEEVARGYSRIFRTKDHPKAKGVDFQIRYPISWRPGEGERPNIIHKFVSENGRGLEMILLMVKDLPLPPGYKVTRKELDEFFTDKELRGMAPRGTTVISAKPIMLDGHKGGMFIFDQTMQRLDITMKIRNLHFVTVRGNRMIFVQCMVSAPPGKESEIQERFNRLEPLFKWVSNSFVIQEQYR